MKAKYFFTMMMATMMVAAVPTTALRAMEMTDTTVVESKAPKASVATNASVMTVNGKPATPAQKDVAKKMANQGVKMAKQGVKMAAKAVTNPKEAERMANELEAMGDEMERLGDSLETLAEDTTFFYEGEDSDAVLAGDEDWDGFAEDIRDIKEELGLNTWWGKLIGGGLGITAGIFGVLVALFVIVLLFALFTAPIWILALIIWAATRSSRKSNTTTYVNPPINPATSSTAQPGPGAPTAANPQATANPQAAPNPQATPYTQPAGTQGYTQSYPDENAEMWKSGIMLCCVGAGLILLFFGMGFDSFWGIGALVAFIGVAKLVIATTTKNKNSQQQPTAGWRNPDPNLYEVKEEPQEGNESTYQK